MRLPIQAQSVIRKVGTKGILANSTSAVIPSACFTGPVIEVLIDRLL